MTDHKILIQKKDMLGDLALFAPAVKKKGGEVCFSSNVPGYEVVFPHDSPFNKDLLPISETMRLTISDGAKLGIYVFYMKKKEKKEIEPSDCFQLQLTIARNGVDHVGFSVEDHGNGPEVHTQLPTPAGEVKILFAKNVVNAEAGLSVCHGDKVVQSITIPAGSTHKRTKLELKANDKLSIRLDPPGSKMVESGGTKVVDIIVDP